MDSPASPPKRVTRSRAAPRSSATSGTAASAAKSKPVAAASKTKTTRTAAAPASKASSTLAAPSTRTSVKRKTRADDDEDDSDSETTAKRQQPASRTAVRATRGPGRPKKIVDPEPAPTPAPAPARATRGRPAKKPAKEAVKDEEPTRTTRTRTKKTQAGEDEVADDLAPEAPVKKPTRGRPAGTTTSTSAQASKPVKKTVTFAEPDKENLAPSAGTKRKPAATKPAESTTTGMRAKPVRKPTTGRATRTAATKKRAGNAEDKAMPLSPKKVTQLSANRDIDTESEDELAMDRAPARAFRRSPMKPPAAMKPTDEAKDEKLPAEEGTELLAPAEPTVLLGSPVRRPPPSPFKDSMKSPAKRIEGLQLGLPAIKESTQSGNSPLKASLFNSPAKRGPLPNNPLDLGSSSRPDGATASPFKQSLFQSPAKRPFSPMKSLRLPEPEPEVIARSPAPTPVLLCTPFPAPALEEHEETKDSESDSEPVEPLVDEEATDDEDAQSPSGAQFNGRMSTVLPREADPTLTVDTSLAKESVEDEEDDRETVVLEQDHEQENEEEHEHEHEHNDVGETQDESIVLDEVVVEGESVAQDSISTTPPNSPPKQALSMFGLQPRETFSIDMSFTESEDELTRVVTPKSASPTKQMRGSIMRPRTSGFGFTPLAQRFDSWQAGSPLKNELKATTPKGVKSTPLGEARSSPLKNDFFEDEMSVRPDTMVNDSINEDDPLAGIPEIKDPVVEDISITDEDLDLAAEANEMSTMSPAQVESMLNLDGGDDTMSDASQEYGDENEVPAGFSQNGTSVPPVTPQRTLRREVHTVSKIPLKPADESTPPPQPSLKKRRHSISRLPATRPTHGLTRSATVISYSPSHKLHVEPAFEEAAEEEETRSRAGSVPPVTPTKSEGWSNAVTPARTPRQDVDPALLRGAVVFVDVHTVEGADASAIFVELLTQMGARCVKAWNWNPNDEDASSKIGITHVVYKDGGKRTMEKVRETSGVVQCVGVGWVLE